MNNEPKTHGENFFEPIAKLPEGPIKEVKSLIAAHSESGHNHLLTSDHPFKVVQVNDRTYIEVMFDALLSHQKTFNKHDTLTIEPGVYEIKHKTEYNPITKMLSRVFD